jgi:hypothetical protein
MFYCNYVVYVYINNMTKNKINHGAENERLDHQKQ